MDLFADHSKFYPARYLLKESRTMTRKIWLAGASGAIGVALTPLLIDAGYEVFGSTRRAERLRTLEAAGVTAVVADVFDAAALRDAMARVAPHAVIHQLTDLPFGLDPARMAQAVAANARIRDEGTRNLVAAAVAAGCHRMIAQSIAWAYRPGVPPYDESCPLDVDAPGSRAISVRGVAALERYVLTTPQLSGTVLRYGQIYGPHTGMETASGASPVRVEAAAYAALLALEKNASGVFNIAEDNAEVDSSRAKRELGWSPTAFGTAHA
jgi:nucleoside-diphosphate-sugar epimerase